MAATAESSSSSSVAAAAAAEVADGPVMSMMSKRLRALKKKYNRIVQMEESAAQGKPLNKEQEEVLRTKPAVSVLIEEYEKLRLPLSSALSEERDLLLRHNSPPSSLTSSSPPPEKDQEQSPAPDSDAIVEDLLKLLYFGSLFDVKQQSEFAATIFMRTHERGCCLTYDYVTDDATDLLHETDLDLISTLGGLVISRPTHSSVSHKNALLECLQHANLWLRNSDQPIQPSSSITYAWLRERLNKILASDYFTTTPEMKATVDVAAAVGKYANCQVQASDSTAMQPSMQGEAPPAHHQHTEGDAESFDRKDTSLNETNHADYHPKMDESDALNPSGDSPVQQEHHAPQVDEDQSQRDPGVQEQQYVPRRAYQNQRGGGHGGGGGRRAYANGRGRGGRGGGGGYQNDRGQYYDPGYYPRNYYNTRGRGGRAGGPGVYNGNGGPPQGGHASNNVDLGANA